MSPLYVILVLLLIFVPLMSILYYFGIAITRMCYGLCIVNFSVPTHWKGALHGSSGFMRRNFVIFKKYNALRVEFETNSGSFDVEVKAPDGSILSPVSAIYGRDTSVLFDVSQFRHCSVVLRMEHFKGQFNIALQSSEQS